MLRLIKAELYKTFNRAYFYATIGTTVFFILSIIFSANSLITVQGMMEIGLSVLISPVFIIIMFVSTTTNEEIKEKTLRNTVSFGVPRSKLYMAKVITSVILSFIAAAVILGAFVGGSFLMFEPGSGLTASFVSGFFLRILSAVPLYTAAIAICALLGFVIKSEMVYALTYAGIFVAVKPIVQLLSFFVSDKFLYIYNMLITTQLTNLGSMGTAGTVMLRSAVLGIVYTVFFLAIGVAVFKRQEIK
jgi:ABC-2 type transport system permease protein